MNTFFSSGAFASFVHFAAVLGIVAALVGEWLTLNRTLSLDAAKRLQWCDLWYGVSAGAVLVAGLFRVFWYDKGIEYYLSNPFFITKMVVGVVVGLLSLYPTLCFMQWSKQIKRGEAPQLSESQFLTISRIVRIELVLLIVMALCASLMARGAGM